MTKDERRKVGGHIYILARKPASIVNPSPLYSYPLKRLLATSHHNQTLLKAFAFRRIPLPFTPGYAVIADRIRDAVLLSEVT
jgi:hypothetical protein